MLGCMSPDDELRKIVDAHGGMISSSMASEILAKRKVSAPANAEINEILSSKFSEGDLVSLECRVHRILGTRVFKKGGGEGFRRSVILTDGAENLPVTLWNKHAEMIDRLPIERGDKAAFNCLRLRKGPYGYEPSSTSSTCISRLEPSKSRIEDFSKLLGSERNIDIEGRATAIGAIRHFTGPNGREGSVSELTITDGERELRLILWGAASLHIASMHLNNRIKVEFADIKQGPNGIEISAGDNSRVLVRSRHPTGTQQIVTQKHI